MRALLAMVAAVLIAVFTLPAVAQRTPPGGDTVGSDRPVSRNDVRSSPTASPDANSRMTQSAGTTSGYENTPAYAGSSTYSTGTAQGSPGAEGMGGQTAATAARRRGYHASSGKAHNTTNVHRTRTRKRARRKKPPER